MPTVELRFTAVPAHVRTARLVAVSLARRAGIHDDVLDEVRLAVGEAATRAVGRHGVSCPDEPVLVRLTDDDGSFLAEVIDAASDAGPASVGPAEAREAADLVAALVDGGAVSTVSHGGDDDFPPGVDLAVISGLVDDFTVETSASGSVLRMRWPVGSTNGSTPTGFGTSSPTA